MRLRARWGTRQPRRTWLRVAGWGGVVEKNEEGEGEEEEGILKVGRGVRRRRRRRRVEGGILVGCFDGR